MLQHKLQCELTVAAIAGRTSASRPKPARDHEQAAGVFQGLERRAAKRSHERSEMPGIHGKMG